MWSEFDSENLGAFLLSLMGEEVGRVLVLPGRRQMGFQISSNFHFSLLANPSYQDFSKGNVKGDLQTL